MLTCLKKQEKLKVQKKFERLQRYLWFQLGGGDKKRKIKIIKRVKRKTPEGGKKESIFVKLFLVPVLSNYFRDLRIEIIIEGVNSRGKTQFKGVFFGSRPAVDFLFKIDGQTGLFESRCFLPFPLNTIGEVKYEN